MCIYQFLRWRLPLSPSALAFIPSSFELRVNVLRYPYLSLLHSIVAGPAYVNNNIIEYHLELRIDKEICKAADMVYTNKVYQPPTSPTHITGRIKQKPSSP